MRKLSVNGSNEVNASSNGSASEDKQTGGDEDVDTTDLEGYADEDKKLILSALSSSDEAGEEADEELDQSQVFKERDLVELDGPSLIELSGTAEKRVTASSCSSECRNNPACNSFTFKRNEEYGWCALKAKCVDKDTPSQKIPEDTFASYFVQQASTEWRARSPVADEGTNLETKVGISFQACKAACDEFNKDTGDQEQCHSFAFNKNTGYCHLKDKCVSADEASSERTETKGFKTYYRPCNGWVRRQLVLNQGKTLSTFVATPQDCCEKCRQEPRCKSVSMKSEGNICEINDKEISADSPGLPDAQISTFSTYYAPC